MAEERTGIAGVLCAHSYELEIYLYTLQFTAGIWILLTNISSFYHM